MKNITQKDIQIIKEELNQKREEFEKIKLLSLEEKLKWIRNFFNDYVPELEKRYLSEEDMRARVVLPDELRIYFYLYFPEHGLNMAKSSERYFLELEQMKKSNILSQKVAFHHQD